MAENLYEPRYGGSLKMYLGTPQVRYLLIDPVAKTHTEGKLPRGELRVRWRALVTTCWWRCG
jgi:hypothetical protein